MYGRNIPEYGRQNSLHPDWSCLLLFPSSFSYVCKRLTEMNTALFGGGSSSSLRGFITHWLMNTTTENCTSSIDLEELLFLLKLSHVSLTSARRQACTIWGSASGIATLFMPGLHALLHLLIDAECKGQRVGVYWVRRALHNIVYGKITN